MRNLDKFKGCLIGGAMGDALGYAVEFLPFSSIQQRYGKNGITRYELRNGKALISDDTQMTLYTANGLLYGYTHARLKGDSTIKIEHYIWRAYKDWYRAMNNDMYSEWNTWLHGVPSLCAQRAPGNTCCSALKGSKIGQIENPINNSKGCGGVMRVAPIGLYFDKDADPQKTYILGASSAAITHGHPLGFVPSSAHVYIINRLAYEETSLNDIINGCIDEMDNLFGNYSETDYFIELIDKARTLARQDIEDHVAISQLGEGWVAEETLAIAVYCCLKYSNDFEKAIIASVNHSGDSDSTGSVTGNILGTLIGYNKLPSFYKSNLECSDVILEIAEDLYNDYTQPESLYTKGRTSWETKYLHCKSVNKYS